MTPRLLLTYRRGYRDNAGVPVISSPLVGGRGDDERTAAARGRRTADPFARSVPDGGRHAHHVLGTGLQHSAGTVFYVKSPPRA